MKSRSIRDEHDDESSQPWTPHPAYQTITAIPIVDRNADTTASW